MTPFLAAEDIVVSTLQTTTITENLLPQLLRERQLAVWPQRTTIEKATTFTALHHLVRTHICFLIPTAQTE